MKAKKDEKSHSINTHREARHYYEILESVECGIVLDGYGARSEGELADVTAFAPDVTLSGPLEAWTEMVDNIPEKVREKLLGQIPLKRFGRADEVGRAVAFLVSADGDYITGAEVSINGGLLM